MPGLIAAVILAVVSMVVLGVLFRSWGTGLWIGVPTALGCLLGYEYRHVKYAGAAAMVVGMVTLLAVTIALGLGGVFCGAVLLGISALPLGLGAIVGRLLRIRMNERWFIARRSMLMLTLFAGLCVWGWIDGPAKPGELETVVTRVEIAAEPDRVWDSLMYYEEVTHPPPWILRVGLARPTATEGWSRKVGETKKCLYNKGWITKRVTGVETNRTLTFDVIEQNIGYERDVRLTGGSFELEPMAGGGTRLVMKTAYRPLLGPRFGWAWAEHLAVGILHEYVGEGIAIRAGEAAEVRAAR
ncbi:MAG: SRPBCC family protein [Planctomycetes bacterium]|nr:SRPBCC family protein [Planctomycetota bacterium]